MNTGNIAIIFGSALTSFHARDIDIAYSGDREVAESAARAWAAERGPRFAALPLDMHEVGAYRYQRADNTVSAPVVDLPSPMGKECRAESLLDPCEVRWMNVRSLSALLRVLGDEGVGASPTAYESGAESLGWFSINLAPEGWCAARPYEDWDDYVNGQRALRNAIKHVPAWKAVVSGSRLFAFIDALVERGPSEQGFKFAERYTSGGQAKIFIHRGDAGWEVSTQYGTDARTLDAAEAFFVALPAGEVAA